MTRNRLPWIHRRKRSEPEVPYEPPIEFGTKSNGEFFYEETARDRKLRKLVLQKCDENARKVGMDRRDFIASTMGMATTAACINLASGCGSDEDGTQGGGGGSGGGYQIPPDAMLDPDAAGMALGGDEFILDLQTHHIEDEEHWRESHPGKTYSGEAFASFLSFVCDEAAKIDCVDSTGYVERIFLNSDTTVAVLSGFPGDICDDASLCNHPISNDDMANSRDRVNAAAQSQRMVQHCQVGMNDQWPLQAQMMERIRSERGNNGWKIYPPWSPAGGPAGGWWLDDDAVSRPFFEKCLELGEPLVCAHKGFSTLPGFSAETADPKDVGPAATAWPDITFVIYHSAVEVGDLPEGPYDPNDLRGANRLVKTVEDYGLKGKNVYAEMGSAWRLVMENPESAQHYIGKLLKHLGEDRVVWGSECTWFNSPQDQIELFRTFQISQEFQDQYGYPEITDEIRRKIFGLNAAPLYGIDPDETRYQVDTGQLAQLRRDLDHEIGGRRFMFQKLPGPRTRREFLNLQKWRAFKNVPA